MHHCIVAADAARLCVGDDDVAVWLVVGEDVHRQGLIPVGVAIQSMSFRKNKRNLQCVDEFDGIEGVLDSHDGQDGTENLVLHDRIRRFHID